MVAQALHERYGCAVVGLDQSADMLRVARTRTTAFEAVVEGRAESLPFADGEFDHLTFTYLLRYVDDPAATMRELARVVKPGGRVAMVEFGLPSGIWRALWRLYTRVGLPVLGRVVSPKWSFVGGYLGPSIERFFAGHPVASLERDWRDAGLRDVQTVRMSVGGGLVMSATKAWPSAPKALIASEASPAPEASPAAPQAPTPAPPPLAPAFYAARGGGWRDYWTLLHPPYTAWHLSYVVLGAALAPAPDPRIVLGALVAFGLAVGIAAHAFDELAGRPLRTAIPAPVLVAMGIAALAGAVALGVAAVSMTGPLFPVFVVAGPAIVVLYGLDAPLVHSDLGFALGWGAFPVAATGYATGAAPVPIILAGLGATLFSLAQRRLSTRARSIRRRAVAVSGEIVFADGTREPITKRSLIAAPEAALSILWIALVAVALATLLARWA